MTIFFLISLCCFLISLAIALEIGDGVHRMTQLRNVSMDSGKVGPRVSIIIPACNEAKTIVPALRSLLSMDYENLEIIVVNDRSVDDTGSILERMKKRQPDLKVYHINDLPEDWLGKNNALQFGAEHATGKFLLFTDADVIMEKTTLSRAMRHVHQNRLDHLSIFFENVGGGGLLNALCLDIAGGLLLLFKPWKVKNPRSKYFMGVGAFNLVAAKVYRAVGRHEKIAMHPIDDIMLGKLIKDAGFRQDCLLGKDFVAVQWYGTVREFVDGLMKNTFAVYQYKISRVLAGVVFIFLFGILPVWALFFTGGVTQALFLGTIFIRFFSFVYGFIQSGIKPWYAFWSVITPYVNIYIAVKAAVQTIQNNGISWRGTHYSLESLKKFIV